MALTRVPQWDTKAFHDYLVNTANSEFKWGEIDCCLFPANCVQVITGTDIASDFRSKYTDETSAFALIKSVTGGATVADAAAYCAKKHGLIEYQHPLMAKRGDLVVISNNNTLLCAIVHLNGRHVVTVGEKGLLRFPITDVKRAWAV